MVNPYQPPQTRRSERSFIARFRHGLALAKREYRSGLQREGFEGSDHLRSWIALIVIGLIGLLISAWVVAVMLIEVVALLGA